MPVEEQGVNINRYMVVPRTLIFLINGDKVLLLKGSEDKRLWSRLYNGVGGHIEIGEDILTSAYRELYEETRISITNLWLCGIVTVDTQKNPGVCIFVFKGELSTNDEMKSKEGTLEWISKTDLDNFPLMADLPMLLPKVFNHKQNTQPFIAQSHYDDAGKLIVEIH